VLVDIHNINTERGVKHCNSAPAVPAFTHRQIGIQQWKRNEDILISELKIEAKAIDVNDIFVDVSVTSAF